jgi:MFS transporter, DHA1 family, tetracycline resistance protein
MKLYKSPKEAQRIKRTICYNSVMHKRALPILFATLLIDMIGFGMIFPLIPILFTDPTSHSFLLQGYSTSAQLLFAGLITAVFGLMQFFASPILGELSDVYGRKKLLTIGVAVLAVSNLLFGLAIAIHSLVLLFVSRAIAGIAGANFAIAQATIADVTEPKDRAKNFGLIGAAFGIGFVLGPLLGGWIASAAGSASAPFLVAGCLGVFNVLSVSLFLPETHHNRREARAFTLWKGIHNIRDAILDVDTRLVYATSFLFLSGFSFFTSFIGVLMVDKFHLSEAGVGTFFGFSGVLIVLTQLFLLRFLTKRYSERTILRVSMLMVGSGLFLYPFMNTLLHMYLVVPLVAVGNGLTLANMTALISKGVSPQKQGAALGINGSLLALAQGIAPLVAGVGSSVLGVTTPFFIGSFLIVGAWTLLFILMPRLKENYARQ